MSNKSAKTSKKLSVPRAFTEIQQEYNNLCAQAGELQYKARIDGESLEAVNSRLRLVNNEAAARRKLDQEAEILAASKATPSETTQTAGAQ